MLIFQGYELSLSIMPIITCKGDSAGNVHALKLSPNLRKKTKDAQLALYNQDFAGAYQVRDKINLNNI